MKIPPTSISTRAAPNTVDDKSHSITIAAWVTLVILVLAFLAREATKFTVVRKFAIDDLFILLATLFAVGLSITSLILASDGLGVFTELTVRRANTIMKAYYASNFLYISSVGFAKLSLVTFFYSIHFQRTQRRFILAFGIFILAWTLASLAAIAFQCGLPRPWEILTLHCYNSGAFWIVYCIIDMTTDVSIIMLSVNLVAYLKVRLSRKIAVVACFAPRVLVIGASLARLIYLYPITPHDHPEFNLWVPAVCTQVQVCLAILTACIPSIRPFFESAESGISRGEGSKRKRVTVDSSYGCCSPSFWGGHKNKDQSSDSTPLTNSRNGRTPDISPRIPTPRIPTPRPLSPLTAPQIDTQPTVSAGIFRSLSERGLRLQIPPPEIQIRRATEIEIASPQSASSHAHSLEGLSPKALLSPNSSPATDTKAGSSPQSLSPGRSTPSSNGGSPKPNVQTPPARFSLFPQPRAPRYSLIPQQYAHPTQSNTPEHSRSRSRTPTRVSVHRISANPTPETRTPSPNVPLQAVPSSNMQYPPQGPSFSTTAYDDPLRIRGSAPKISVTLPISMPTAQTNASSIPSSYVATPQTARISDTASPQTIPSYYMNTPPTSRPPTFPLPTPPPVAPSNPYMPTYDTVSSRASIGSHRQRNQRILTPRNSSRPDQISPVSPASPEETPWEQAQLVPVTRPVVRDLRNSPRIVVQRFS